MGALRDSRTIQWLLAPFNGQIPPLFLFSAHRMHENCEARKTCGLIVGTPEDVAQSCPCLGSSSNAREEVVAEAPGPVGGETAKPPSAQGQGRRKASFPTGGSPGVRGSRTQGVPSWENTHSGDFWKPQELAPKSRGPWLAGSQDSSPLGLKTSPALEPRPLWPRWWFRPPLDGRAAGRRGQQGWLISKGLVCLAWPFGDLAPLGLFTGLVISAFNKR